MKILVRNPFTLDADDHSFQSGLSCPEPTLTVQADAAAADINNIVKQFGLTGQLPYGNQVPEYADFSDMPMDYHSALNFINDATEQFMEFPANVRSAFDNDPGNFLDVLNDPSKRSILEDVGLVSKLDPDPAPPVQVKDEQTSDSASGTGST